MRAGVQALKSIPIVSLSGIEVSRLHELKLGSYQLLPVTRFQQARSHLVCVPGRRKAQDISGRCSLTARSYNASTASRVHIEFDNPRYQKLFLQNEVQLDPFRMNDCRLILVQPLGLAVIKRLADISKEVGGDSKADRESRKVLHIRIGLGTVRLVKLTEIEHEPLNKK